MPPEDKPQSRPWREIARELQNVTDPDKFIELAAELDRALAEQGVGFDGEQEKPK